MGEDGFGKSGEEVQWVLSVSAPQGQGHPPPSCLNLLGISISNTHQTEWKSLLKKCHSWCQTTTEEQFLREASGLRAGTEAERQ